MHSLFISVFSVNLCSQIQEQKVLQSELGTLKKNAVSLITSFVYDVLLLFLCLIFMHLLFILEEQKAIH